MADPRLRGTLSACILLTNYLGLLLPFLIYFYPSWKIPAFLGASIALIALVGYSFLHESQVWYVIKDRISDARNVFSWLWGSVHHVEAERDVEELLKRVVDEMRAVANGMGSSGTYWGKWKQYLKPHVYKPFIIMQVFNLMYIVYWTNLSVSYDNILDWLNEDMLGFGNVYVLIMLNLEFIFNFCVILLWFGRRIICVSSGVGSGIAALLIGTLVYMQTTDTWVFTGLNFLYVASTTCAYFVMAQTMIGEILPSNIRCVGGAFIFTMNYIVVLLAKKYFLSFLTAVGTHCVLWIFGVSSLLCSLFLYLMLP